MLFLPDRSILETIQNREHGGVRYKASMRETGQLPPMDAWCDAASRHQCVGRAMFCRAPSP
jgi:hypothetical protein